MISLLRSIKHSIWIRIHLCPKMSVWLFLTFLSPWFLTFQFNSQLTIVFYTRLASLCWNSKISNIGLYITDCISLSFQVKCNKHRRGHLLCPFTNDFVSILFCFVFFVCVCAPFKVFVLLKHSNRKTEWLLWFTLLMCLFVFRFVVFCSVHLCIRRNNTHIYTNPTLISLNMLIKAHSEPLFNRFYALWLRPIQVDSKLRFMIFVLLSVNSEVIEREIPYAHLMHFTIIRFDFTSIKWCMEITTLRK